MNVFALQGLSPPEVIEGYEKACKKALEILPGTSPGGTYSRELQYHLLSLLPAYPAKGWCLLITHISEIIKQLTVIPKSFKILNIV